MLATPALRNPDVYDEAHGTLPVGAYHRVYAIGGAAALGPVARLVDDRRWLGSPVTVRYNAAIGSLGGRMAPGAAYDIRGLVPQRVAADWVFVAIPNAHGRCVLDW